MGRKLNYSEQIKEDVEELSTLLRAQIKSVDRDRIRFLLLLKQGKYTTQKGAAEAVNIGLRQAQINWKTYRQEGISALVGNKPIGAPTKLSQEQLDQMEERLKADDIQFLHEAVDYVQQEFETSYTLSGMHYVFKRLKIKKKTGRPSNINQVEEDREDFKKNLPS